MIRPAEQRAIRAGGIDLAFRRWERPRVVVGTRLRTGVGLIEVTSVERVAASALRADDARRAGAASLTELRANLDAQESRRHQPIWRVGLRHAGADPREELRSRVPDAAELTEITAGLERLDAAAADGPWTLATLRIIDEHPATRAPDLAATLGRETPPFKTDVRKLKERGLTESLDIGYRISPRGAAVLDHLTGAPRTDRPAPPSGTPLPRVGQSARRALTAAGIESLQDLASRSIDEVGALPGVGPVAVARLTEALADAGLTATTSRQPRADAGE